MAVGFGGEPNLQAHDIINSINKEEPLRKDRDAVCPKKGRVGGSERG